MFVAIGLIVLAFALFAVRLLKRIMSIDHDARTAMVVWLPDGEAAMPVDMLDD